MKAKKPTWYWGVVGLFLTVALIAIVILGTSLVAALLQARKLTADTQDTTSASDLASKAQVQQQNGDLEGAEQLLEKALIKEQKTDYQSQLAVVEYRLKKYDESIADYKKLINAHTDPAFAWNGIGNAYRDWAVSDDKDRDAHQASAIDAYTQAISADPGYVAAYTNEVLLLIDMGKKDQALSVAKDGYSKTQRNELQELVKRLTE